MKNTIRTLIASLFILNNLLLPFIAFAGVESSNEKRKLENIEEIKEGKKLQITETFSETDYDGDRFVVFVKKETIENSRKKMMDSGGVTSFSDSNTYGKVMAIPLDLGYMKEDKKKDFLETTISLKDTVAIVPVQKRSLSSVPSLNDPLFPTDTAYDSNKQWYLSPPSGSYFGIDVLRAWQYLDAHGVDYNGNSSVVVAVIDTGAAFENYSKYNQYTGANKMVSPLPWSFIKSTDFTSTLFSNGGEMANNQLDDDAKIGDWFCIDKNSNTLCDTGEPSSYIDDKNGLNIVDWGKYWSRVTFSELGAASVCTNEPYASDGVKCVSTFSNTSHCTQDNLENYNYYGCYESDMGHPNDVYGHGTLVSNIITATHNNSVSGVGIASGVSLLPIKIFGETFNSYRSKWVYDSAYGDQIANAINYAVEMGVDIINLSFAGSSVDYYEKMAIDNAYYNNDVLIVASSGNGGSSTTNYPAGYDSVLSVGASTKTGARASYSDYGSTLDLVAPVDSGILTEGMWDTANNRAITASCSWDSTQTCMNVDPQASPSQFSTFANLSVAGTSFATPQVVGAAALLKSIYPNLTAKQLAYILKMSSSPAGSANNSTTIGSGVLNVYNAVQAKEYRSVSLSLIKRMYQTNIGSNGYMYTRFSDNFGASWSTWIQAGNIKTRGGLLTLKVPSTQDSLVQVIRGTNSGVYVRNASDFGFNSYNDSLWSDWTLIGYASGGIYPVTAGNNVLISFRGTNGLPYTFLTSNGTSWVEVGASVQPVSGSVQMVVDTTSGKILQAIRSSGGYIYVRTSSDNGGSWSSWVRSYDVSASDPQIFAVSGKIIRVIRRKDNILVTRYSTDGGTTWSGRNRTYGTSGLTKGYISFAEVPENGTLIQTWKAIDNKTYSRYSADYGVSWSVQKVGYNFPRYVYATGAPTTLNAGGNVIQTVRANNAYMYYRLSMDGGRNWGTWRNTGSIKITGVPYMWYENLMNRVYITARGIDGYVYVRTSDNKGISYSNWYKSGTTTSGIRTDSTLMETFNLDQTPL